MNLISNYDWLKKKQVWWLKKEITEVYRRDVHSDCHIRLVKMSLARQKSVSTSLLCQHQSLQPLFLESSFCALVRIWATQSASQVGWTLVQHSRVQTPSRLTLSGLLSFQSQLPFRRSGSWSPATRVLPLMLSPSLSHEPLCSSSVCRSLPAATLPQYTYRLGPSNNQVVVAHM